MSELFGINLKTSMSALALVVATTALGSCVSPPKTAVANEPADIDLKSQPISEPPNELAILAERDVEAFLSRRREATERGTAASPPPEILWNQPPRRRPIELAPAPPSDPEEARKEAAPTLASDATTLKPASEPEPPAEVASNEPTALDPNRLRELIIDLSKELYQEASYADMPLRELLLIAATSMVTPDRALVPEAIPGLTTRERELLAHFQSFFLELGRTLDGSKSADEVLVDQIEALRASLVTEPRLELGTLTLCTRVGGYGDYTTFDKNAFLAHSEQRAIVYIEIAGFTSVLNSKGEWVTELSQQLMIYSERDGIPVWREEWQSAVDVSRNRRNDFFVVQIITLPKALSVGRYHLKVRVRDEKSRAEAESAIPFEMVADPRMAGTSSR